MKHRTQSLALTQGFTLVELLVTISIIGLLASITVVSVGNVRQVARDSKRLADIKQMQTALEFYFNQRDSYPNPVIPGGSTDIQLGTANYNFLCSHDEGFRASVGDCGNAAAVYMSRVPLAPAPPVNTYYLYRPLTLQNGRPTSYEVRFSLETDIAGFAAGGHVASPSGVRRQ